MLFPGEYRVEWTGTDITWAIRSFGAGDARRQALGQGRSRDGHDCHADGNAIAGAVLCRHSAMWAEFPRVLLNGWRFRTPGERPHWVAFLKGESSTLEADGFEPEVIQAVLVSR